MKILIYGLNFSPELTGVGKYTGDMAAWLANQGHDIRVITAPPYYPEWRIANGYSAWGSEEEISGVSVFRTPLWVPASPTTVKRLLHLISFAIGSIPQLFRQLTWRPNIIVCIAPSFFCAPSSLLFASLSGCRSWLHIQDFEIDAMFGLGMINSRGLLASCAFAVERLILRRFNRVSSISRSMCDRLISKGVATQNAVLFPNWVDTEYIRPRLGQSLYRQLWCFNPADKVVLYSGNLGKKQGLEIILEASKALSNQKDLFFVIVGEGAHKETLLAAAQEMGLKNVLFYPLQPYQSMPELLKLADLHLVIQKRGAADAVMPSKLTGILAAGGHAVITADACTELGRLVESNPGIATLIEPENVDALVNAITSFLSRGGPQLLEYNHVARKYSIENLDSHQVLARLEQELQNVLSQV